MCRLKIQKKIRKNELFCSLFAPVKNVFYANKKLNRILNSTLNEDVAHVYNNNRVSNDFQTLLISNIRDLNDEWSRRETEFFREQKNRFS